MDAIEVLVKDHRTVEALFKRFEKAGDGALKMKKKIVEQIIEELSRHSAIEEQLFYPAVRELNDKLEDTVLESLEEHHVVKWLLSELDKMNASAERFDAKVTVLIENVRHHVEEEEEELFPKVRKAMKAEDLQLLGEHMTALKRFAPTHPHPRSPDEPPGNVFTTPVASAMDRGRDLLKSLTARATKTKKKSGGRHVTH